MSFMKVVNPISGNWGKGLMYIPMKAKSSCSSRNVQIILLQQQDDKVGKREERSSRVHPFIRIQYVFLNPMPNDLVSDGVVGEMVEKGKPKIVHE